MIGSNTRIGIRALLLTGLCVLCSAWLAAPAGAAAPAWRVIAATGPTNLPPVASERQRIEVDAEGGTFTLSFESATTGPLPYDASSTAVGEALNGLSTIGGSGASVAVTGGPGGTDPYFVRFGGSLSGTDVPAITADPAGFTGGASTVSITTETEGGSPGQGWLAAYATNVGGGASTGAITMTIGPLPPGITTSGSASGVGWTCEPPGSGASSVTCTRPGPVQGLENTPAVEVPLSIGPAAPPQSTVLVAVEGGGAAPDPELRNTQEVPVTVSEQPVEPGIQAFWAGAFDDEGNPSTQAGAHPHSAGTAFFLNTNLSPAGQVVPAGDLKDLIVDLPPGFIGNPMVTKRCPQNVLIPNPGGEPSPQCGPDSIVGGNSPMLSEFPGEAFGPGAAIYNNIPPKGYAAEFTFPQVVAKQSVLASLRSDEDFGVSIIAPSVPPVYKVFGSIVVLQGAPAAADGQAFLTNPTSCAHQAAITPVTSVRANAWHVPELFDEQTVDIPPVTGCEQLKFEPSFTFQPSAGAAASVTGATAHLSVPQDGLLDPAELASPHLKRSAVTLPDGLVLNPSAAAGLEACTTEQIGYLGSGFPMPNPTRFDMEPVSCPDASKIGTAEVKTPLLEDPLKGTVYLAAQNDNPFNSLLAMYLVVDDEKTGTVLKLPGEVRPDPQTGQLTAIFDNNPQVPFTDLTLNFRGGGPRSTLATPDVCGDYTTTGEFTPWSAPESGPPAQTKDSFAISGGPAGKPCPSSKAARPFGPGSNAGTTGLQAGGFSPFVLHVNRADGEQEIKRIDIALPPGLTGKLAGIPYCSELSIEAAKGKAGKVEQGLPSCPPASRIGKVSASAGVGSEPISVDGTAYLAGPYAGAPLSIVVITPAVSGPFDLGNVVIRTAVHVDPHTAALRAVSDEIPHILQGIPLQLRSFSIQMDRDNFTLNPTSCERMSVGVGITGAGGNPASTADDVVSNHAVPFQVDGCGNLGFTPKLKLKLKGSTRRSGNPGLRAVLTQPPGQANIARTVVIMPESAFIDNRHINNPCTRVQFAANACPPKSILGTATAWSPLLDEPVTGNVYFRSNGGERTLPDLVAVLKGQVDIELIGFIDSVPNKKRGTARTRNTFAVVPDAPVSRFELNLKGGKVGLLQNSVNLCKGKNRATVKMKAHNGKSVIRKPIVQTDCGKKKGSKGGKKGRGGGKSGR